MHLHAWRRSSFAVLAMIVAMGAASAAPSAEDQSTCGKADADPAAAIAACSRLLTSGLPPADEAGVLTNRGAAFANSGERSEDPAAAGTLIDEALADYDAAVRLGASSARLFTLRGVAWSDKEDYGRAIGDFDRALKLDAGFEAATRARDFAVGQAKQQDRDIDLYDQMLTLQPQNAELLLARANVLIRKGRRDAASRDIEAVLAKDPKNEAALGLRAALAPADAAAEAPDTSPSHAPKP